MSSRKKCGFDAELNARLANNPGFQKDFDAFAAGISQQAAEYEQAMAKVASKTTATVTLPVVFHVILTQAEINTMGGTEGVYKRAVLQLDALNRDFNARNADSTKMHSQFKPKFGNAQMNFALVHRKPDGTGTIGVEIRIAPAGFPGFSYDPVMGATDSVKKTSKGGLDPWDNKKYLNIWVCRIKTTGLLGWGMSPNYANLLSKSDETGIAIHYQTFGQKKSPSVGSYISGCDSGRTLVHEMGHFLNLWHIWGNTAVGNGVCSDDDDVSDTPQQSDANQDPSCPFPQIIQNCTNSPGGEMYMNYMDYSGDKCEVMFTKGQVTRMQAQVAFGGMSYELTQHPEILQWPTDVAGLEAGAAIEIMPNPTSGYFNINIGNPATLKNIVIINTVGQAIRQINTAGHANSYNFDLSGMPKGIYMVQCRFDEGIVTRKIVLQ